MERDRLEDALETLGELLAERGHSVGLLVIGGGSLLLLGFVERPTADVDVGRALALGPGWLNAGPAGLIDFGLPEGLEHRVAVRRYGSLEVHLPAREDLICFKLYAAVDQGRRNKHMDDLRALSPFRDELVTAARWTRTHDPSAGFLGELRGALALFHVEVDDGDL